MYLLLACCYRTICTLKFMLSQICSNGATTERCFVPEEDKTNKALWGFDDAV